MSMLNPVQPDLTAHQTPVLGADAAEVIASPPAATDAELH